MSITLFSVTLAGAIGAINAIDNLTTSYVSEGATLVNCTIDTNPIGGEQGDRFASIRIKEDPTGSYKTVPGDKLTLQIYET